LYSEANLVSSESSVNNSFVFEDLAPGIYTATITSEETGCYSEELFFELQQPDDITYQFTTNPVLCNGENSGSINILLEGGTPPYNTILGEMNGNVGIINELVGNNIVFNNLSAGDYYFSPVDQYGCMCESQEVFFSIEEPEQLVTVETISNYNGYGVSCNGENDGYIEIEVNGGYGTYSFEWSNGQTTQNISNLNADSYSLIVTDENGCSTFTEIEITEPTPISISNSLSDYNGYNISCIDENDGYIDITVSGGTGVYSYQWGNGNNSEDISELVAGTYSLTVTDENECIQSAFFEITEPSALEISEIHSDYNSFGVSCYNGDDGYIDITVTGGTGVYSYQWENGNNSEDLSNLTSGYYSVIATDQNGCSVGISHEITEPSEITVSETISNYNGYGVSCNGENDGYIEIEVSGGYGLYSFEWSNGDISESTSNCSLEQINAGTYTVLIKDENNCYKSIDFEITEPEILFFSTENSECIEEYGEININNISGGTGPYQYKINEGFFTDNSIFTNLNEGNYSVTVIDQNGCSSTENFTLNAKPIANFSISETQFYISDNPIYFYDQTIDLNIDSWIWDFGNGSSSNEQNPSYTYKEPGVYYVKLSITDQYGCEDQIIKKIEALYEYYSYTPNIFTPNGDGINDIFQPSILNINRNTYTLFIYDRWGNTIYKTSKYEEGWDGKIDNGELLPPDTYNYKIIFETKTGKQKQEIGRFIMAQ
ncbi:MAG: hypothetical protein CMP65_00135, partial [Flavobacteriales bacterium]|nr:hypothetical protein [Flavobacteriales bacterium]